MYDRDSEAASDRRLGIAEGTDFARARVAGGRENNAVNRYSSESSKEYCNYTA